jgi:hypothetical protein
MSKEGWQDGNWTKRSRESTNLQERRRLVIRLGGRIGSKAGRLGAGCVRFGPNSIIASSAPPIHKTQLHFPLVCLGESFEDAAGGQFAFQ